MIKKLLPLLLFLTACNKDRNYTCFCSFKDGKVYSQRPNKDGGRKKTQENCETQLGSFGDSLGVTCKMYDSRDKLYKCLHTVTWKDPIITQKVDTQYFFPGITVSEKDKFITDHTFVDTFGPGNYVRTHSATCSESIIAVY